LSPFSLFLLRRSLATLHSLYQDRFLAHLLAGRDLTNKNFTLLPPHFVTLPSEDTLRSAFCGEWMEDRFDEMKGVLMLLLASAVNNIESLKIEKYEESVPTATGTQRVTKTRPLLPTNHTIFSNNVLHGSVHTVLLTCLAKDEERYKGDIMQATGIPPWSLTAIEVKRLTKQQALIYQILLELKESVQNGGSASAEAIAQYMKPMFDETYKRSKRNS